MENNAQAALQQAVADLKNLVTIAGDLSLHKGANKVLVKVNASIEAQEQVRQALLLAHAGVRRIEASRAVQGDYDNPLSSILDQILQIATPLVAMFGDFELSNLLGSLKVWLDRKKVEEEAKRLRQDQYLMQSSGPDIMYTYQF